MSLTINLTDDQLWDAVIGSGAFSFGSEWYVSADYEAHHKMAVVIDCEDVRGEGVVTPAAIREAIAALREKHPNAEAGLAHIDLEDEECDSDFDAITGDCIIQQIVLGDVVFG